MSKAVSFMMWMWLIVSIAGGVYQQSTSVATTALTADINASTTTITVASTEGFPNSGIIVILDERIGYPSKTATTFKSIFAQPVIRGFGGTDNSSHVAGELVRTVESSMMNSSMSYKIALLTDSSGILAFVTIPLALLSLLGTFLTLPLGFLGTDLEILTYIYIVISIGIIVSIAIRLAGGRRV